MSRVYRNAAQTACTSSSTAFSATEKGNHTSPYIQQVRELKNAYPALNSLLCNLENGNDEGRIQVEQHYAKRSDQPLPGRCTLLLFEENGVNARDFLTPEDLHVFLESSPAGETNSQCRLWVLEDLHVAWVSVLGKHLGVDPTVFSEQINTWHFTNSDSIPSRALPSMVQPQKSFTLRYYELRRLRDPGAISVKKNQMTFATNRRRYERWRDIDTTSLLKKGRPRHGFVRRCASFWTNQRCKSDKQQNWDAVMLVDPAFDSVEWQECGAPKGCTILQDPKKYDTLADLWDARSWKNPGSVKPTIDTSEPYHDGPSTLANASMASTDEIARCNTMQSQNRRNRSSLLDELVFYWTRIADKDLILTVREESANSAHYLLKYIATLWNDQLELIACGVAESEYYADDHQATINSEASGDKWRKELEDIDSTTQDINYQKRQLMHFDQALVLNLERLGLIIGNEIVRDDLPQAIRDAQLDFINIRSRLLPFAERVASLGSVANNLANLHTASVVFPMTLVSSMLSMGEDFLPGRSKFWIFWAVSVPLVCVLAGLLLFERKVRQQLSLIFK